MLMHIANCMLMTLYCFAETVVPNDQCKRKLMFRNNFVNNHGAEGQCHPEQNDSFVENMFLIATEKCLFHNGRLEVATY